MKAPRVLMPRWRCLSYNYNNKASFYTHIDYETCLILLHAESRFIPESEKLKEWVMIDDDCC